MSKTSEVLEDNLWRQVVPAF